MSLKKYKTIDIILLAVILAIFEALASVAASKWFPLQLFTLSPTFTVVCIVMMRWGAWGAVHAAVGGLTYCIASGATPEQFAVYCIGNCFSLIALVFFKFLGKERVRKSIFLTAAYALTAFFGGIFGRWIVSLFFAPSVDFIMDMFVAETITLLFTVLVTVIARKPDGLFEDQKSYLIRTQDERNRREDTDAL